MSKNKLQCDNSPTFVLQNSELARQNCGVQRLANCHIDSLFFGKVKSPQIDHIVIYVERKVSDPVVLVGFRPGILKRSDPDPVIELRSDPDPIFKSLSDPV